MDATNHGHPVDARSVARAKDAGLSIAEAENLGQLLALLSDPIRVRALFCLSAVDELCVGDLAAALDISMDQSSYALRNLKSAGLVQARRDGRIIYHRLTDGFPQQLLEHCLRQLLEISEKELN
ncbi:MAG TPA: metalloregulator ArsR/SmtB family transcription factor [Microbacterium sp.]|nr:metalloregulator ArsR/SmtB family transcription factor [Microbacterium sp.]